MQPCAGTTRRGAALRRVVMLGVALCAFAPGAFTPSAFAESADEVAVMPYRPTVSIPAALSAIDWVEVETGLLDAGGDAAPRRASALYTIKFALSADWGIRFGGEFFVRDVGQDGRYVDGGGDTAVVLKRRFAVDERSAFGLEVGVNVATARYGLHSGSGATDYGLNAIYSTDLGSSFHTDINLGLTRMGSPGPCPSRELGLWSVSLSDALDARWGIAGEFSGTSRLRTDATSQFLFAVTFSPHKRVTFDLGLSRGMTAATPAWTFFAGSTFLVSRL